MPSIKGGFSSKDASKLKELAGSMFRPPTSGELSKESDDKEAD